MGFNARDKLCFQKHYPAQIRQCAIVMGMDSDHNYQTIHAKVPLAEMDRYSTSLSSLTSGRGTFTMKYAEYQQVPTDVQNKLLKEYEESQKEEE